MLLDVLDVLSGRSMVDSMSIGVLKFVYQPPLQIFTHFIETYTRYVESFDLFCYWQLGLSIDFCHQVPLGTILRQEGISG